MKFQLNRRVFMRSKGPEAKSSRASKHFSNATYLTKEFKDFSVFFNSYLKEKTFLYSSHFERNKNIVVKTILIKRGKRNRVFLHASTIGVLTAGVVISPFISQADLFTGQPTSIYAQNIQQDALSLTPDNVFRTDASEKPRDEIMDYTVQKGDTVSTIAKKFAISEDTIRWANGLKNDKITVGDQVKILPVTGVSHKVERGDTVYSIAQKYDTNPQVIVDFPFNDFANPQTFSLVEGQIVIVPDGIMPDERPSAPRRTQPRYIASPGNQQVFGSGFAWPINGTMNQYFSWYHPGLDLGASTGTPIVAAQSGTVVAVYTSGWNSGYGSHVIIQGGGYTTLYAHMSQVAASVGQSVTAGQSVIGYVGSTGRSTGPHLHFEVRGAGGNVNPLNFLQ